MQKITACRPDIIACDMHPGYYSTRVAQEMKGAQVVPVQHHHAHVVSCMAENRLRGKVIGLAMDGTGYGSDGRIWGGEFLVADASRYERAGHIQCFMLPGAGQAIHEPWRCAAGLLREAYGESWQDMAERLDLVPKKSFSSFIAKSMEQDINAPSASSLGRVFDAVASILGLRCRTSFEGQAAMALEAAAQQHTDMLLPYDVHEQDGVLLLDIVPAVKTLVEKRLARHRSDVLATAFHNTLCHAFASMARSIREKTGLGRVVLSGGCFQNRKLLEGCIVALGDAGFEIFTHHLVPTNDGGIALGQAVIAGTQAQSTGHPV